MVLKGNTWNLLRINTATLTKARLGTINTFCQVIKSLWVSFILCIVNINLQWHFICANFTNLSCDFHRLVTRGFWIALCSYKCSHIIFSQLSILLSKNTGRWKIIRNIIFLTQTFKGLQIILERPMLCKSLCVYLICSIRGKVHAFIR